MGYDTGAKIKAGSGKYLRKDGVIDIDVESGSGGHGSGSIARYQFSPVKR
jgi:hypothetical protein